MRLDKFLADSNTESRKELKKYIHRGLVTVNSCVIKDPACQIPENAVVFMNGRRVEPFKNIVIMMHKPSGYVTSTDDPRDLTVMDLIPQEYQNLGVVPVGRLDKDTEGLLLFTNDGNLIHKLISPKTETEKTYYAEYEGELSENCSENFKSGIVLKDGTKCKPAVFNSISSGQCLVTITEGMYHQVRRMLASQGLHVTYLKRISENGIELGDLEKGKIKDITSLFYT